MGLRGHKVTQITEYKPLDDEDSEYDVRSYPQKPQPHCLFFMWTWSNVIQGKLNFYPIFDYFCPNCNFYTPKITNLTENGMKSKKYLPHI